MVGLDDVTGFITQNAVPLAIGTGVAVVGGGVALAAVSGSKRKKKNRKGIKRDRMFKSKQKHEQRYKRKRKYKIYGKRGVINPKKKKSGKRRGKTYYTKRGQPYILKANGQAKFIKGRKK